MLVEGYADRILDKCHLDYYLSASYDGGRIRWPWRMFPPDETYQRYRDTCEKFIVDSDFNDETVTNRDVLDKAVEVNATMAVLEDVYQDYSKTVERLQEGLRLYKSHAFDGDVLCPLQAPHVECWEAIGKPERIAIGGVKDKPASEKVRIAQKVRDAVGANVWVHGLGFGATPEVVQAVRENPDLLDSIDAQTPFATENDQNVWPGTERMSPVALRSQANLIEKCRRMSPELTEDPNANQTGLGAYQ